MSVRKFKFVSPGIFINEIDNSQVPKVSDAIGPVVIGRSQKGPGLQPVKIESFSEFIDVFGAPLPGGQGGDIWRKGSLTAPTYGVYAAQAWLKNNTPLTFVRLTGRSHADATGLADTISGFAGFETTNTALDNGRTLNGGAFGLFVCEGTGAVPAMAAGTIKEAVAGKSYPLTNTTGTLAAIWYLNEGSIALSGSDLSLVESSGSGQYYHPVDTSNTYKVIIKDSSGNTKINTSFNFTPTSARYARKVFNTNPTLTNADITSTDALTNYWLGETFEGNLNTFLDGTKGITGSATTASFGIILPLGVPDNSTSGGSNRYASTKDINAKTGWFVGQHLESVTGSFNITAQQKLFRFVARDFSGAGIQNKVKISIKDIKRSSDPFNDYGSFTVLVRDIKDTDNAPIILEQYNNCNLNPASDNYVAKKIGDSNITWSDDDRRYKYFGNYPNISSYIRIQMNEDTDRGQINTQYLPFGVFGHPRYLPFATSGSAVIGTTGLQLLPGEAGTPAAGTTGAFISIGGYADRGVSLAGATAGVTNNVVTGSAAAGSQPGLVINAIYEFPKLRLRVSSSEGAINDPQDAYFGVDTTYNSTRFDESVWDVLRPRADSIDSHVADSDFTETAWLFSLDDVRNSAMTSSAEAHHGKPTYTSNAVWESGSYVKGISFNSHTASTDVGGPSSVSYINVLDAGFDQFTTCLHGGTDALNIKERDPFNNSRSLASGKTELNSYAFNSVKCAIDALRDPEIVDYNIAAMPGITSNTLNDALIKTCEARGDSLAVIDIPDVYDADTENTKSAANRVGTVASAVANVRNNLQVNSSYACTYYPWVQIRDTLNGATLWAPPSVAILGTLAYGEKTSQLWFAPAGFTRGGLSANSAAGLPVVGVSQKLTSKERDTLYDANINPIASFPAEGIVVFGQKTLQVTPSALDRINVRRLVIFLKKQISRMAATLLFDQNVQSTWNRFRGQVEPFLDGVKAGLGITAYRLILDETTTTPDLIDRNIMYAKIFVKPARAIEFIAIDFVITDSGAAFGD